uniref:Uncharacterized protein n=1 Tax=Panagrolaimus davidi TaxID=227884 RepID=A0A914QDR7_9BILA
MTSTSQSSDFVVNLHYSSLDYLTKTQFEEFGDFNITDADTAGYEYVLSTMPSKQAISKYVRRKTMDGVIVQQCEPGNIHPRAS